MGSQISLMRAYLGKDVIQLRSEASMERAKPKIERYAGLMLREMIYEEPVKFADEINMIPLRLHKEQPGKILNTMLVPFLSAAQTLPAADAADHETIDHTWELAIGAPAGPIRILDAVGLETAYNINRMKPDARVEGSVTILVGKLLKRDDRQGRDRCQCGKRFL